MTDDPIPVAVVGVGNMGANHARVYHRLPEAELVEVVDADEGRASEVAEQYDARVVGDVGDLERARAATIAVPNHLHREIAVACIKAGLDVLVEKPIATTVKDAEAIVDVAADFSAVLQAGHIERFNPALQVMEDILADQEIVALEAHRLGPFNDHLTTESVVFDLMIHDIDVIDYLVDSHLEHTVAVGAASQSDVCDHAIAQFKFENGVVAAATASHVTHSKVRTLEVTTVDAFTSLDYQQQSIIIQRRGREQTVALRGKSGYRTETVTESPYIQTREPLKIELEHFLESVRTRRTPRVDGEDGVRAVSRAAHIVDMIRES